MAGLGRVLKLEEGGYDLCWLYSLFPKTRQEVVTQGLERVISQREHTLLEITKLNF